MSEHIDSISKALSKLNPLGDAGLSPLQTIDEFQANSKTPTEQMIELERAAIPALKRFHGQIISLSDGIEEFKSGRDKYISDFVVLNVKNLAGKPGVKRFELTGSDILAKFLELQSEGYTLLDEQTIKGVVINGEILSNDKMIAYMAEPGFDKQELLNSLVERATALFDNELDYKEKDLARARERFTEYRKLVQRAQANIETLADVMKKVK